MYIYFNFNSSINFSFKFICSTYLFIINSNFLTDMQKYDSVTELFIQTIKYNKSHIMQAQLKKTKNTFLQLCAFNFIMIIFLSIKIKSFANFSHYFQNDLVSLFRKLNRFLLSTLLCL